MPKRSSKKKKKSIQGRRSKFRDYGKTRDGRQMNLQTRTNRRAASSGPTQTKQDKAGTRCFLIWEAAEWDCERKPGSVVARLRSSKGGGESPWQKLPEKLGSLFIFRSVASVEPAREFREVNMQRSRDGERVRRSYC